MWIHFELPRPADIDKELLVVAEIEDGKQLTLSLDEFRKSPAGSMILGECRKPRPIDVMSIDGCLDVG